MLLMDILDRERKFQSIFFISERNLYTLVGPQKSNDRNNQFDISILSLYIFGSYYKQMVNTNSRLVTATVQK